VKVYVRADWRNGVNRPRLVSSYTNSEGKPRQKHWASVYLWPQQYITSLKSLVVEYNYLIVESNRKDIPKSDRIRAAMKAGKVWLKIGKLKKCAPIDVAGARALNDRRRLDLFTGRRRSMQESHDATPVVTVFTGLAKAKVALERSFESVKDWDPDTRQGVRDQICDFKQWLKAVEAKIR
jgi:hypothetical protein